MGPAAVVLLLALADAGGLTGRVVDAQGAPAPGVRVILGEFGHATLFYNSPKGTFVATPGVPDALRPRYARELATDEEGRFVADDLAAGEFSLVASDERLGIGLGTVRVPDDGSATVEIALAPPAFVDLEVVGLPFDPSRNTIELAPVANGTNIQFNPRLEPVPRSWNVRSTALPALDAWRAIGSEVVFGQAYRATLFTIPVSITSGERSKIVLDVSKGTEISGAVADGTGQPLAGVSVIARPPGEGARELGAVTDAGGRYKIRGLSTGMHVVEALRWKVRDVPGCGNGAQDVGARREVVLPLAGGESTDFRIEGLLPAPIVGEPAPAFEAQALDGGTVALRDLRGKVVLLDFWATWCGACRLEFPGLIASYDEFARDGRFEIVGVSVDRDVDLVPRFVASRGLRWPQTVPGPAAQNPVARLFNVNSTPSTVLIDAEGRIAALNLLGEPLRAKIEELLAGK